MNKCRVKSELEVFDKGMITYAQYLIRKWILIPPQYFNLLFRNTAGFTHMGRGALIGMGANVLEGAENDENKVVGAGSW